LGSAPGSDIIAARMSFETDPSDGGLALLDETTPEVGLRVRPGVQRETRADPDQPTPWNVVLLDDEDHSYEYVIVMMARLFGHSVERGFKIARAVDTQGRAVCLTTHKEHAELKRDQILAFGAHPLIAGSAGAMRAVIEPAEFEGDESDESDAADGARGDAAP